MLNLDWKKKNPIGACPILVIMIQLSLLITWFHIHLHISLAAATFDCSIEVFL
jgi:hypothetical protein